MLSSSGHSNDAMVASGMLERELLFLPEPFTEEQLASYVREALAR